MEPKEDEEISLDFSKIKDKFKDFFKSEKAEEKSEEQAKKEPEDDVTIDFTKIKAKFKNFFKSKEKEEKQSEESKEKKDSGELSFDFSKIKKFFKSDREKESAKSDDEITISWDKAADFFKKYGMVFIALIPIILAIYIRLQAGFLPFTDDWAENTVINTIKSQIRSSIDQQHPNLPDANKNAIADTELQRILSQNEKQINEQIKATSIYFKSFFQDEDGKRYMPDIDPYYWYRYTKNILEHGYPGDVLKDGKSFDTYQLAPLGRFVFPDMFHSYLSAYFYKVANFFASDLALINSMFYLIVFFSAICVLLVFLIARKIAGTAGGFFAALMMAVNGAFLSRTLHPDNDVWVVFFPLLVTWLFVAAIDTKNVKIVLVSAIAGFFTGLFTTAWTGWWYIFDFLLATIAITLLYLFLINIRELRNIKEFFAKKIAIRNEIIFGLVYFISTAVFVVLFSGWKTFLGGFLGPLRFPSIKAPVASSLWPNVLTTVAELNEGSINGIINSVGGPLLFFISLLGLALAVSRSEGIKKFDVAYIAGTAVFYAMYFLFRNNVSVFGLLAWIILPILIRIVVTIYKKDATYDFKLPILLSLWVMASIFASIKGIRFTLLLAPAFSVAFGVAIGKIYTYLSRLLGKELKIQKAIGSSILIVLLLLLFYINPTRAALNSARYDVPIVNDAWYNSLIDIKQDSSENAIITSWWDFGHHFKALADRPVTFDGTTQTSPAAHWVGKLLSTDNETEAIGILRMLDCGSNNAFDALYSINNDTHLSLKILNEIIVLDKANAEKRLKQLKFDDKQIEKVILFTHCEPPEAYFIASEDMIGKSGVWAHFGSWNFERADIWFNARRMPQEKAVEYMMGKFNYTKERAENTYFEIQAIENEPDSNKRNSEANAWVAPWPGYGGTISCRKGEDRELYSCDNGLIINLSNYDIFGVSQQGIVKPKAAAFTTEDGLLKKEFDGNTLGFGVTAIPKSENELELVVSSSELVGGMFTRMFYMQGHGLRFFKLFDHQRGFTGTNIYTYKVDWQGKNTTIVGEYVDYLKPPEDKSKGSFEANQSDINSS